MHGDVGIRMALEALRIGNGNAAQDHRVTLIERMHVDALPDAHIRAVLQQAGRHVAVGHDDVVGRGQLAVLDLAHDHGYGNSGMLGNRGIVGQPLRLLGLRLAIGGEDVVIGETLRRLGGPDRGTVHGAAHHAAGREFQRLGHRHAGDCGGETVEPADHAVDQCRRHERPGGVVDQHLGGLVAGHRFDPDAAGFLAGRSADDRQGQVQAIGGLGEHLLMALANDRLHDVDGRMLQKGPAGPPDHRPAANELVLFRPFAPGAQAGATGHDHCRNCHDPAVASAIQPRNKGP